MRTNELGEAEPESNDDVGYINDIIKARKEGAKNELEELINTIKADLNYYNKQINGAESDALPCE